LSNCQTQPSSGQLDQWRNQAIALNQSITATVAEQKQRSGDREWELAIQGQTPKKLALGIKDLKKISSQEIKTVDPNNTEDGTVVKTFQGIAVAKLLDRVGVEAGVKEITFLSFNDYRVTVPLEDLRNYPILLAWDREGKPLTRSQGGPLYLIFPYSDYPELPKKYSDAYWAFYVTDVIIGDESINLKVDSKPYDVGSQVFDRQALEALPQTTIRESVGYKIGWTPEKVPLKGVRLQEIIAKANFNLSPQGRVLIKGKASINSDRNTPVELPNLEIANCDIILATRWGEQEQIIPAKMGGPVTLAFSNNCRNNVTLSPKNNKHWATLVERIEVN
jgi:hypothetical protein